MFCLSPQCIVRTFIATPYLLYYIFFTPDVNTAIYAVGEHRKAYKMSDVFVDKFVVTQPYVVVHLLLSCCASPGGHGQVIGRIWSATLDIHDVELLCILTYRCITSCISDELAETI